MVVTFLRRVLFGLVPTVFLMAANPFLIKNAAAQYSPRYSQGSQGSQNYGRAPANNQQSTYNSQEILDEGHRFFGETSKGLAQIVERATSKWGEPSGYILGQEGSGAFVVGVRYGEGTLHTRYSGSRRVFWQGPSLGWDFGGEGSRTMILVYELASPDAIFQRFAGINGSAYIVGGVSMTALAANGVVLVPIKTGVGVRLGVNVGYLHFTPKGSWVPF